MRIALITFLLLACKIWSRCSKLSLNVKLPSIPLSVMSLMAWIFSFLLGSLERLISPKMSKASTRVKVLSKSIMNFLIFGMKLLKVYPVKLIDCQKNWPFIPEFVTNLFCFCKAVKDSPFYPSIQKLRNYKKPNLFKR